MPTATTYSRSELGRVLAKLGVAAQSACARTMDVGERYGILAEVVWPKNERLERVLREAAEMDAGEREMFDYTDDVVLPRGSDDA